jgi:hypothetical protein
MEVRYQLRHSPAEADARARSHARPSQCSLANGRILMNRRRVVSTGSTSGVR